MLIERSRLKFSPQNVVSKQILIDYIFSGRDSKEDNVAPAGTCIYYKKVKNSCINDKVIGLLGHNVEMCV